MFITFEGGEGSGKSTQAALLRDYLASQGKRVFLTKEPGGTEFADVIREILLGAEITDVLTEFLLLSSARRDHILKIKQKLEEGFIVISDRFFDSSIAIQWGAKNLDLEFVVNVTNKILDGLCPDITFLLDIAVETLQQRLKNRGERTNFYDNKNTPFHQKVRDSFLQIADVQRGRVIIIDAENDVLAVARKINDHLMNVYKLDLVKYY